MEEKSKLGRFSEFEFLKALAMIGLPIAHIMEEAVEEELATESLTTLGGGVLGLSIIGPAVFMICMGFGIGGGKTSADSIRRSGIQFLLIGFILNILRWFIPGSIQCLVLGTSLFDIIYYCVESDIYYFVGLFFVGYSFLKKWGVNSFGLLVISVITLMVNTALAPLLTDIITNQLLSEVLGNFIHVNGSSYFPLLSWAIYPTVGIILGEVLKKGTEEFHELFMKRMMFLSVVFFLSFALFLRDYRIDVMKVIFAPINGYYTDLPNTLLLISISCFMIGLTYYICKAISNSRFMGYMMKLSTYIIPFYLLQWIIISWIFYILVIFRAPKGFFGLPHYIICVVIVTAICLYLSTAHGMKIMRLITKVTHVKKKRRKGGRTDAK